MKYLTPFVPFALAAMIAITSGCSNSSVHTAGVIKQTHIHKYGVQVSKSDWELRGKDGIVVSTMDTGVVISHNYRNGQLHGNTTYSFPHSHTIEKIETYEDDNLVRQVVNYASGIPKRETRFTGQNTKTLTTWFETGTPNSIEEYDDNQLVKGEYLSQDNEIEARVVDGSGARIQRDPYGQLISTDTFEEGQLVTVMTYHSNGHPKEVIPYQKGVAHGEKKTFLAGGEPNTIEQWVGGCQEGITIEFQNGSKVAEVPYVDGYREGIEKRYTDEGEVVEEVSWIADRKHGPTRRYFAEKTKTDWFHGGKLVSKIIYDQLSENI